MDQNAGIPSCVQGYHNKKPPCPLGWSRRHWLQLPQRFQLTRRPHTLSPTLPIPNPKPPRGREARRGGGGAWGKAGPTTPIYKPPTTPKPTTPRPASGVKGAGKGGVGGVGGVGGAGGRGKPPTPKSAGKVGRGGKGGGGNGQSVCSSMSDEEMIAMLAGCAHGYQPPPHFRANLAYIRHSRPDSGLGRWQ